MGVIQTSDVDFDPVFIQRIAENVKRVSARRKVVRQKLTVTDGGVRFGHRLGVIPVQITIMPLSEMIVWHYEEPDATNVYLKSSIASGDILISMSGE